MLQRPVKNKAEGDYVKRVHRMFRMESFESSKKVKNSFVLLNANDEGCHRLLFAKIQLLVRAELYIGGLKEN